MPQYERITAEDVRTGDAISPTYSITIKGAYRTFTNPNWCALTFDQVCSILSDLTGYRIKWLRQDLPSRFDRLGYATQKLAIAHEGERPVFLIRSSDGSKPPAHCS